MESHEQALLLPDDSRLNYGTNFCDLQSEVQMQLGSACPVTHEQRAEGSSAVQESGMNTVELAGNIIRDDNNSVLENGRELREPVGPVIGFDKRHIVSSDNSGRTDDASGTDSATKAGVCIGTIVSVNEQVYRGLAKPFTDDAAKAHRVGVPASRSKPENRIDYGASLAMEDFGGEFEDGHGIEESPFASVDVFADSVTTNPDTVNAPPVKIDENFQNAQIHTPEVQDIAIDTIPEEQPDVPESLDKILPAGETSLECEDEEPPVLEREVISKAPNSKQIDGEEDGDDVEKTSSKLPSGRSQRHGEALSGRKASDSEKMPASNLELNVNSRPRRSVNRKSVLELLHVDYRYVGGPKKVATHRASEGEVNHEPPTKKRKSPKKGAKVSDEHPDDNTERPMKMKHLPMRHDHIHDIDDRINALKKKVVGYKPDDFLDDDVDPELAKDTEGKDKKSTLDADKTSLKESVFAETDELAARSFLSAFAVESAEALSSSKQEGDIISELDALTAENHELRSRIKTLEQSKILTKKFNIDFHGRKFSRVRSPAVASPDQQKTPGKIVGSAYDRTPPTERKAPVETGESMLSRIAVLDRREHKLRELSAELDERATSVKIAEGALRRRERKLLDFEKTLEHRERVLSRHEQSLLKRELVLGSPALPAGDSSVEEGEDRQSLAAEIQRRLEQRRLELDRRQTAMDSERTRLEIRERELDQRAGNSRMAEKSLSSAGDDGDGNADTGDRNSSRPSKRLTSTGNQKRKTAVTHSIRSKYLSQKKKVF